MNAQGIEARSAETRSGSVEDESPTRRDAPPSLPPTGEGLPEEIVKAIRQLESAAWVDGNIETEAASQGRKVARNALNATILHHLSAARARAERAEIELAGWKRVAVVAALPLEAMRMAGSYRALSPSTQACVDEAVVTIRMAVAGHSLPPEGDMDAAVAPARAALSSVAEEA